MIEPLFKTSQLPHMQLTPPTTQTPKVADVGGSFEAVLKTIATNSVDSLQNAEKTAIAGLNGKAPVQQVVEQVMAAERTLQTAIAVRDKVVAAYQEISRMAI